VGKCISLIDGDSVGDTVTGVHHDTGGTARAGSQNTSYTQTLQPWHQGRLMVRIAPPTGLTFITRFGLPPTHSLAY
jgi:hypothetical protein